MARGDEKGTNPVRVGKPDTSPYDQMQVMASLQELQRDMGSLISKVERLISDRRDDRDEVKNEVKDAKNDLQGEITAAKSAIGDVSTELKPIKSRVDAAFWMVVGGFAVACFALTIFTILVGDDFAALWHFAKGLPRPGTP